MVRSITQNTIAGNHFLSILQHMLLIRDDYFARLPLLVNREPAYLGDLVM